MKQVLCVSVLAILTSWMLACNVTTDPQLELGKDTGDGGASGAPNVGEGGVKDDEPETAVCGDGVIAVDDDETCDDGNAASGDGCSSRCAIETGYACPLAGAPCEPIAETCPAGAALCGEICVDVLTNTQHCGGCDLPCSQSQVCVDGACEEQPYCGDGIVNGAEQCDDGVNDGETSDCQPGCVLDGVCGDGVLSGGEACDDGNVASLDGCRDDCTVELGWVCSTPGQPCMQVISECPVPMTRCAGLCVNLLADTENCGACGVQCADGLNCEDGVCFIDPECAQVSCPAGQMCRDGACVDVPYCGDGVVQPELGEQCDDGVNDGETGDCYPGCVLPIICGDGTLGGPEECDDANTVSSDGCSSICALEPGYACPVVGEPCVEVPESCPGSMALCGTECVDLLSNAEHCGACGNQCGDGQYCEAGVCQCPAGIVFCGSECIDVATHIDHCGACDNPCPVGFTCSAGACEEDVACEDVSCPAGSRCVSGECVPLAICGDGVIQDDEQCDDGNSDSGDGCSADCTIEPEF